MNYIARLYNSLVKKQVYDAVTAGLDRYNPETKRYEKTSQFPQTAKQGLAEIVHGTLYISAAGALTIGAGALLGVAGIIGAAVGIGALTYTGIRRVEQAYVSGQKREKKQHQRRIKKEQSIKNAKSDRVNSIKANTSYNAVEKQIALMKDALYDVSVGIQDGKRIVRRHYTTQKFENDIGTLNSLIQSTYPQGSSERRTAIEMRNTLQTLWLYPKRIRISQPNRWDDESFKKIFSDYLNSKSGEIETQAKKMATHSRCMNNLSDIVRQLLPGGNFSGISQQRSIVPDVLPAVGSPELDPSQAAHKSRVPSAPVSELRDPLADETVHGSVARRN